MYIHNSYDQCNMVTMVEPRFFSKELKKYGGILVYVPYFISGYCFNYEELNLISAKGAINSDFVILQSNALKNAYLYWGFPERKLLVLGSPKIDAIRNLSHKKVVLDENWKRQFEGKKVILLNSSISDLLNNSNGLAELKENILTIIKRKNFALIWRPHPLLYDTIKAMRCEQKQLYEEIIEILRTAHNAVIDNNSDASLAMLISDAMVSDYSSLILQYTFTGKPILVWSKINSANVKYIFCDFFENYFKEEGISVEAFLDMIQTGEDLKREERMAAISAGIENTDGTCGEKVHAVISQSLMELE